MAKRERITDFKVQRPIDYDEKAILKCIEQYGYVLVQPKHDGIRGVLHWDSTRNQWLCVTRENIEIVSISERLKKLPPPASGAYLVWDCEVVLPDYKFQEASGILRRLSSVADDVHVVLHVFDVLDIDTPLQARVDLPVMKEPIFVSGNLDVLPVPSYRVLSLHAVQDTYAGMRLCGYEGVVIKNPGQHYTPNKVQGWWKLKPSETVDGIVTGFVMGEEGKANEGKVVGFVVKLEDGSTCKATGFTRQLIHEVTSNPGSYKGRYVEVSRMEATDGGASRHPSFVRFRDIEGAEGIKA